MSTKVNISGQKEKKKKNKENAKPKRGRRKMGNPNALMEFLIPYMKLEVRVPDLQILFVDYQMKNLSSFSPNFSQVESLTLPNQIYQWSPWLHQFKYYSPWLYHDELHQWNPWFYNYMESWLYQFKNWSLWLSPI